jgi:hypothetical protein
MTPTSTSADRARRYYQALCAVALVGIFLVHVQQDLPIFLNMPMLFIGAFCIIYASWLSPVLVLLAIAAMHLFQQYSLNLGFNPDFQAFRFLALNDVLLCLGTLTFLVSHYRLQSLHSVVGSRDSANVPEALSAVGIIAVIFPIPLVVLAAEFTFLILRQHWQLVGLPPRWKQFLAIAWFLLIGMFVAAHAFRYFRRLQMGRDMARLMLQDIVWNETRGEQRRIFRWWAWWKLRGRK